MTFDLPCPSQYTNDKPIIMSQNPINLSVRFILEIIALIALGAWAKSKFPGALGIVLMILIPLLAAVAWGTVNVKDDPSRSGKAPVPVPGILRLMLELALLAQQPGPCSGSTRLMAGYSVSSR